MIDSLLIGYNDIDFEQYVKMVRSMGTDTGAWRDLDLAFVEVEGKPYRALDILDRYQQEHRRGEVKPYHNFDYFLPAVLYLGSYLSRRGYSFDYINMFQYEKDKLREILATQDVLTVAVTTTFYIVPEPVLEVISFVRSCNSKAKIIVGGPFIGNQTKSADPVALDRFLRYLDADIYVISNEGEQTLTEIINALKQGQDLQSVPNIAYRNGDGYVFTPEKPESNPLEGNQVAYDLFPKEQLGGLVSLRTAKSCPFTCAFCGFPERAGRYVYLSVEDVERELEQLAALGSVDAVTFLDDTFNVPKKRFKDILRMMIRRDFGLKWNSFYRSDHGDEETIGLMAQAGCEGVFLGVESGSDTVLEKMNKTARRKHYLKAIPMLRESGIATFASLIVGFPGETQDTLQETLDLVEETGPDFYRGQLWYADPVTPVWKRRDELSIEGEAFNWAHETMDYKVACDLVERMLFCVKNSVWLPQWGFELWSTYYLRRRGMSLDQIKSFVRCFNDLVKEKLLSPGRLQPSPELLERQRATCLFDVPEEAPREPATIFEASDYIAAERFWVQEFFTPSPQSNIEASEQKSDLRPASAACRPDPEALRRLTSSASSAEAALLAAFSTLLSRSSGQEDVVLAAATSRAEGFCEAFPLRLRPGWESSFEGFQRQVADSATKAAEHHVHAFYIVSNQYRLNKFGASRPQFDVGFLYDSAQPGLARQELDVRSPGLADALTLNLSVWKTQGAIELELSSPNGRLNEEVIQRLASYLGRLIEAAGDDPSLSLGAIPLQAEAAAQDWVESDAAEAFQF